MFKKQTSKTLPKALVNNYCKQLGASPNCPGLLDPLRGSCIPQWLLHAFPSSIVCSCLWDVVPLVLSCGTLSQSCLSRYGHVSVPCHLSVCGSWSEVCWAELRNGLLCLAADGPIEYVVDIIQSMPKCCWSCCCWALQDQRIFQSISPAQPRFRHLCW